MCIYLLSLGVWVTTDHGGSVANLAKTNPTPIYSHFNVHLNAMNRTTALHDDTRFRVLRLLEERPDMTQREIADALGISLGGVNYCLRALANKGMVKIQNFRNSKNKVGYLYLLTPEGVGEKVALTEAFLRRKMAEYEALRAEIESLRGEAEKFVRPPSA